jgi:hypothetical protein
MLLVYYVPASQYLSGMLARKVCQQKCCRVLCALVKLRTLSLRVGGSNPLIGFQRLMTDDLPHSYHFLQTFTAYHSRDVV